MPEILLPAFHVTTTRKISVEVHHELATDLDRYKAFYKDSYGADVSEADLMREMTRRFMESDREFQDFKIGSRSRSRNSRRAHAAPTAEAITK
jgi:hypothetical protein